MSAERTALALCLDVLGPLTLRIDGQEVEVPGTRRRALLALLALEAGRVASTERLVECLWPDEPPDNAVQAIYNHISRLRGHLGAHADRLERRGSGYRLILEPDELDVDAARRLARAVAATPRRRIKGLAQWCPERSATPPSSRMVARSWAWTPSMDIEITPPRSSRLVGPCICRPGTSLRRSSAIPVSSRSWASTWSIPIDSR